MFGQKRNKHVILTLLALCVTTILSDTFVGSSPRSSKIIELNQTSQLKFKLNVNEETTIKFNLEKSLQNIEVDILSSALYQICVLDTQNQCSGGFKRHGKKDSTLTFGREQIANGIKIRNPSNIKKIKIKMSFHSQDQECHKLENRMLNRKQLRHHNCFLFELNKMEDFQLVIVKDKYMDLNIQLAVCGQNFEVSPQNVKNNKYFLKFTDISKLCTPEAANRILKVGITHTEQKNNTDCNNNSYIGLILQYAQQSILLPDGISYTSTFTDLKIPKRFQYQLLNRESTTINVISQQSLQIYVKVVEQTEKDKTIPSKSNSDFSSKSGFIFTYWRPYLTITKELLQKFSCLNCYIVVGIFASSNLEFIGNKHSFSIEITQFMSTLVTGQMKHHFLQAGAMAFYSFTAYSDNMVVYQLSDNNKGCALFYLSDQQVPGPQNFIEKSNKNRLIYKSEQNKIYYIGVKAQEDCAYSISATIGSTELVTLQKGRYGYLNMQKNQTKYFLIQVGTSQYIKLLSLHIYGSVEIYLNKTDSEAIKNFNKNQLDYTKFSKKGQYMNRLLLKNNEQLFCEECYYLVAVVSKKLTESTLFYGDENTPIPIHDKVINDMIPIEGGKVKGEYEGQPKFQLQVKIHSGKLKISVERGSQKFTENYKKMDEISTQVINIGGSSSFFEQLVAVFNLQPISVQFQALENNTIYSIRFKEILDTIIPGTENLNSSALPALPEPEIKAVNYELQPGNDLFVVVSSENSLKISGYLRDSSEKILLSTDIDQKDQLSQLNITMQAGSKQIQYSLQKMSNILTLSVPKLRNYSIKQGIRYTLSIVSNISTPLWFTMMQTEDFQLLSPEVYTNINNQYTFVTHTQSELIVQLFQCRGKSSIVYAPERQQLDQNQSLSLDIVGLPNQPHAFRINRSSTTFYKVTVQEGILRWFPFNIEKGVGTGYIDYKVGSLHYESSLTGIKLIWQSLAQTNSRSSQAKTAIVSCSYTLYIAEDYKYLSQNSQCEQFLVDKTPGIMKFTDLVDLDSSKKINSTFEYNLQQRQLINQYGQNVTLYATIVADLLLTLDPNDEQSQKERYRFIYPQIQIPNEFLQKSYVTAVIQSNYKHLVSAVLLVVAGILVSTYLLTSKLLPVLGRLKNRYFVEQNEQQMSTPIQNVVVSQNQNQEVPQSSDRRGIVASAGEAIVCEENK